MRKRISQSNNIVSTQRVSDTILHLLDWYEQYKRALPWRQYKDPYILWLSEVILQQTRVQQGLPYFERFIERFPTVNTLAEADEQEVLRLWQGLGYYRRARNMHTCAKQVMNMYDGIFPSNVHQLAKLKGIGKYTAAAVASFASNAQVAVVDGNVYRVLSRYLGINHDVASPSAYRVFEQAMLELMPIAASSMFNQAVMELGALVCTPSNPICDDCPLSKSCYAFGSSTQDQFPVKRKKKAKAKESLHYVIVEHNSRFLMARRGDQSIWGGMYDFLNLDGTGWLSDLCAQMRCIPIVRFRHELTHKSLDITASFIALTDTTVVKSLYLPSEAAFYSRNEIESLPKSVVVLNILRYLDQYLNTTTYGRSK